MADDIVKAFIDAMRPDRSHKHATSEARITPDVRAAVARYYAGKVLPDFSLLKFGVNALALCCFILLCIAFSRK